MRISVAMATYNGARFIREQLDSLSAQTRLPDELVVSDDSSTDRTLEIVAEFSRAAPFPVRVFRNAQNVGFSENFLHTAELCAGDWIAFCDQDDVWSPRKLEILERHTGIPGRTILLVAHNAEVVDEALVPSGISYHSIRRATVRNGRRLPNLWVASGFTMMFKAELISRIPHENRGPDPGIPNVNLSHDVWISRIARILGDVVILPDNLALYRRHGRTTSRFLRGGNQRLRRSKLLSQRIAHLAKNGAAVYRAHARCAEHQAAAFGLLASQVKVAGWNERFLAARADYSGLSKWLLLRSYIHGERRLPVRLWYLLRTLSGGGYIRFNGNSLGNVRRIAADLLFDALIAFHGPR